MLIRQGRQKLKALFKRLNTTDFKRIIANSIWMLLEKLIRMIFGLFVGIWVARYLGPEQFGVFSYAVAFVGFFIPFSALGLNHLLTRDMVRDRNAEREILGTAWTMRFVSGIVVVVVSSIIVYFLRDQSTELMLFVALLSFGQSFKAFLVIDFWYQSHVRSKYVVISRIAALLISNTLKIIGVLSGFEVLWFIAAMFIEYVLSELLLTVTYILQGGNPWSWSFSSNRAISYLKQGWPLIISGFAAQIYLKLDAIMIGQLISDSAVGLYSAAARISEVWYVVPGVLVASSFPKILQMREQSKALYTYRLQQIYMFLAALGTFIAIVISTIAIPLIELLFGAEYAESGFVLQIHVWAGVFIFMRALFSKWIISEGLFKLSILTQGSGAILNVAANIILIPYMGIRGAAVATLISYAAASYFVLFFHRDTKKTALMMTKAILFPFTIWKYIRRSNEDNS